MSADPFVRLYVRHVTDERRSERRGLPRRGIDMRLAQARILEAVVPLWLSEVDRRHAERRRFDDRTPAQRDQANAEHWQSVLADARADSFSSDGSVEAALGFPDQAAEQARRTAEKAARHLASLEAEQVTAHGDDPGPLADDALPIAADRGRRRGERRHRSGILGDPARRSAEVDRREPGSPASDLGAVDSEGGEP